MGHGVLGARSETRPHSQHPQKCSTVNVLAQGAKEKHILPTSMARGRREGCVHRGGRSVGFRATAWHRRLAFAAEAALRQALGWPARPIPPGLVPATRGELIVYLTYVAEAGGETDDTSHIESDIED